MNTIILLVILCILASQSITSTRTKGGEDGQERNTKEIEREIRTTRRTTRRTTSNSYRNEPSSTSSSNTPLKTKSASSRVHSGMSTHGVNSGNAITKQVIIPLDVERQGVNSGNAITKQVIIPLEKERQEKERQEKERQEKERQEKERHEYADSIIKQLDFLDDSMMENFLLGKPLSSFILSTKNRDVDYSDRQIDPKQRYKFHGLTIAQNYIINFLRYISYIEYNEFNRIINYLISNDATKNDLIVFTREIIFEFIERNESILTKEEHEYLLLEMDKIIKSLGGPSKNIRVKSMNAKIMDDIKSLDKDYVPKNNLMLRPLNQNLHTSRQIQADQTFNDYFTPDLYSNRNNELLHQSEIMQPHDANQKIDDKLIDKLLFGDSNDSFDAKSSPLSRSYTEYQKPVFKYNGQSDWEKCFIALTNIFKDYILSKPNTISINWSW